MILIILLFCVKIYIFKALTYCYIFIHSDIDINPVASKLTFETTQDIQLTCTVKGNHGSVVFRSWTQKIGSSVVRTFDGFNTDNETLLKIAYSSYQDVGNYTCYVYDRNGIFINSKGIEVTINEEIGETNAHDSTVIGIVIGVSVTVAVTVTVVIVIYFARRRRINKNENETVKMNEKIESKYEELQVRTAQEPYDAPGTEVQKNIYINDVGVKDHYGHSQTEEDKAEYEEIQGRENSTLEPKSEYEITEIN
ncbi:hypothetical protein KUTeg_009299 [Tegillarca granosa]|uniref:Ig-like domain-containing protein n=1 Tax=Tegillarca granosa TaxID=220873 RepID=A0ABQ9F6Y6_TEGGR|nr:hypothetical protein KUTeg_009299 [Tegillarca granosa]